MSEDLRERLMAPFPTDVIRWKPQTVSGKRALVVAFLDARAVMDRLDDAVGVMGWQDHYEPLPDGSVVCRLQIRVGEEWITKEDVGSESEQPDEGDRRKAAFSDALKRAAVKFGIGRYLYRLAPQWVDYDPQTKRIVGQPHIIRPDGRQSPTPGLQQATNAKPTLRPAEQKVLDGLKRQGEEVTDREARRAIYRSAKEMMTTGAISKQALDLLGEHLAHLEERASIQEEAVA